MPPWVETVVVRVGLSGGGGGSPFRGGGGPSRGRGGGGGGWGGGYPAGSAASAGSAVDDFPTLGGGGGEFLSVSPRTSRPGPHSKKLSFSTRPSSFFPVCSSDFQQLDSVVWPRWWLLPTGLNTMPPLCAAAVCRCATKEMKCT